MRRRRLIFWVTVTLAALALAACSGSSSNLGKYYAGRTLNLSVVAIERAPELRYATIDPKAVVRRWRVAPSSDGLELIMVRMKVENHTAIKAIVDVDQQAAELRDFIRGTYFPIDLSSRLYQDLRNQPAATVHMSHGQCFDPNRMYISQATTVNWVNDDSVVHYVKLDLAGEDLHPVGPGESFSYTFTGPEIRDYQCSAQELPGQKAQVVVEQTSGRSLIKERSMLFINGSFELQKGMGIEGWIVFEAPKGTEFRDLRWRAGDSITITF